jgi:hypothetical protein
MKNPNATTTGNAFRNGITFILTNSMINQERTQTDSAEKKTTAQILTRSTMTYAGR